MNFDKKVGHCIYSYSDKPKIIYDCEHFDAWPLWIQSRDIQDLVSPMLIETDTKKGIVS